MNNLTDCFEKFCALMRLQQIRYFSTLFLILMFFQSQILLADESVAGDAIPPLVDYGYFKERIELYDRWIRYEGSCCMLKDEVHRRECLFAEGLAHERSGNNELAVESLKASAKLGNTDAQVKLGLIYLESQDDNDLVAAIEWYRAASKSGDPVAKYMMSRLGLLFPELVDLDNESLLSLLESSGNSGFISAVNFLGETYLNGLFGITASEEKAMHFFRMSAEENYPPGLFALGAYHIKLNEVAKGVDFLERAAIAGYPQANQMLGLYHWGHILENNASKEIAVRHFKAAFEGGINDAAVYLGIAYSTGWGTDLDYAKARQYLEVSEGSSEGMAESSLAQLYARGLGVDQDLDTACEYYRKSASFNNPNGQYGHGICLRAFGEKDAGLVWIRKAAEQGLHRAELYLSELDANRRENEHGTRTEGTEERENWKEN